MSLRYCKSRSVLALTTWSSRPRVFALDCTSLVTGSARLGLVGLMSKATTLAAGTMWCNSSSHFDDVPPVRLRPGRLKLSTNPNATGSPPIPNTIGMSKSPLCRECCWCAVNRRDYSDLTTNRISCKRGQSIVLTLRPAILDCNVPTLGIAALAKAAVKRFETRTQFT